MRNWVPSTLCDCEVYSKAAETIFGEEFIDFIVTPKYHTPSQSPVNQFCSPSIYYREENWKNTNYWVFSSVFPFLCFFSAEKEQKNPALFLFVLLVIVLAQSFVYLHNSISGSHQLRFLLWNILNTKMYDNAVNTIISKTVSINI